MDDMANCEFHYGCEGAFLDVSPAVYSLFHQDGRIVVHGAEYDRCFAASPSRRRKCLKITDPSTLGGSPVYVAQDAQFAMQLGGAPAFADKPVRIVYFLNAGLQEAPWFLLRSQLEELKSTGLLERVNRFTAVVCGPARQHDDLARRIARTISFAEVECHEENRHEHPGIFKVWELARQDASGLTLYFHGKGITRIKRPTERRNRTPEERRIFRTVIGGWREALAAFDRFGSINKVGLAAGGAGWMWFNYWWARNEYLSQCEWPIVTNRRHYYESWLQSHGAGSQPSDVERPAGEFKFQKDDCYNLGVSLKNSWCNIGTTLQPYEAALLASDFSTRARSRALVGRAYGWGRRLLGVETR